MNPSTLKSFERMLDRMERQGKRSNRRFTASPFVLILGLILANALLTRLVPMIWDSTLPGGLDQVWSFRGWPALLWRLVLLARMHQVFLVGGIAVVGLVALAGSYRSRGFRLFVWLGSLAVIAMNAGIIALALRTSMMAAESALGQGFGIP
jgi:hypothetical protein